MDIRDITNMADCAVLASWYMNLHQIALYRLCGVRVCMAVLTNGVTVHRLWDRWWQTMAQLAWYFCLWMHRVNICLPTAWGFVTLQALIAPMFMLLNALCALVAHETAYLLNRS